MQHVLQGKKQKNGDSDVPWAWLAGSTPGAILRLLLSGYAFDVEVYDRGWRLIPEDAALLGQEHAALQTLGEECSRFLR